MQQEKFKIEERRLNKFAVLSVILSIYSIGGSYILIFVFVPILLLIDVILRGNLEYVFLVGGYLILPLKILGLVSGIVAIFFGGQALRKIDNQIERGRTFAILGIVIGCLGSLLNIYFLSSPY